MHNQHLTTKILIPALALLFASAAAQAAPISYNGHNYFLTTSAETWTAAEAEAVADGGHLASIHSQADENFLVSNLTAGAFSNLPLWIGFYDPMRNDGGGTGSTHANDFIWSDGSSVSYTDWYTASGEPNNNGNAEYWTAMNWHYAQGVTTTQGQWNDTPNNGTSGFGGHTDGPYYGIIEVPISTSGAPEPGTSGLLGIGLAAAAFVYRRLRRR